MTQSNIIGLVAFVLGTVLLFLAWRGTNTPVDQMTEADLDATITRCRRDLVLPVSDALARPAADLVAMVLAACPGLRENRVLAAQ